MVLYANGVRSAPDTLEIGSATYYVEKSGRSRAEVLDRCMALMERIPDRDEQSSTQILNLLPMDKSRGF